VEAMETRKTRILHVIPHLGPAGAERVVVTLMDQLDPDRFHSRLVVLGSIKTPPGGMRVPEGTLALGYGGSRRDLSGLFRCLRSLRREIRAYEADVVHAHLWPACRMVGLASLGLRSAILFHIHDTRPWLTGTRLRDHVERAWTRILITVAAPYNVAVSCAVRDLASRRLHIPPRRMWTVPNAIDNVPFANSTPVQRQPGRPAVIGVLARLSPEKGHRFLLEAVRQLDGEGFDLQLDIAGTGAQREPLETRAAELGLAGRVRFLGYVSDIPAFLASLDMLVLPSIGAEGLPLCLLEGMCAARPVVATDVAGTSEIVHDRQTGMLVPPADASALAGAIRFLLTHPEQADAIAATGQESVRSQFSFPRAVHQLESVYAEIKGRKEIE
jgi:glycosyltransferase involved in cell wall biosynthesis